VDAMANYAIDILSDEAQLRAMGRECRKVAAERFSSKKIIPQYEEFYWRVLARSS